MDRVTLTWAELYRAAQVGLLRRTSAMAKGSLELTGRGDGWDQDIEGAIGEKAFAKWGNFYWDESVGKYKSEPDVHIYDVRFGGPSLIIRSDDLDERPMVLVVVDRDHPHYQIPGWVWVHEGKQERWFTDKGLGRPPAYFVPQSVLRPMVTLPDSVLEGAGG